MKNGRSRPEAHYDVGLQHERTALAWERTAVSAMVVGVIMARYAANVAHPAVAVVGLAQTTLGAGILVWSGWHYDDLHGPLRRRQPIVHPSAARLVGITTVCFSGFAFAFALVVALTGW